MNKISGFGINKKQELTRLIYEISKSENIPQEKIAKAVSGADYRQIKKDLLKRRYPQASLAKEVLNPYLPKIEFKPSERFNFKNKNFSPKNIFIEEKAADSALAARFKSIFNKAKIHRISSLKDYLNPAPGKRLQFGCGIKDYNKRRDNVFIVNERHDFFKKCPCTKGAVNCGYHIFNLGFGCIFECAYCFLQGYTNSPGIILPANIESFFKKFDSYKKPGMRIGTGEFSDSLVLDEITEYSKPMVEFFKKNKDVIFEFKTKSNKINNLLGAAGAKNIVVSWSLNPQRMIDENEFFTASLNERISSAQMCVRAGYRAGFHFDPIIYYDGWQKDYEGVIENLFDKINPKAIAWISLGTFRFPRELKPVIERRFPHNTILDAELLPGYDGKLRYPLKFRMDIYRVMQGMLRRHSEKLKIYLCMEDFGL